LWNMESPLFPDERILHAGLTSLSELPIFKAGGAGGSMVFRFICSVCIVLSAVAGESWTASWNEAMSAAAESWSSRNDPAAARKLYGDALDTVLHHGPGTLRHARTLDELAYLNLMDGMIEEAEARYLESIPMLTRLLGADQPRVATSIHNLGVLYLRAGRDDDAEPRIREALRIWTASFGPDHLDTARANRSLSVLMRRKGLDSEADRLESLAAPYLTAQAAEPER
jgi:tetratricopeptide (TPR) repeat protein